MFFSGLENRLCEARLWAKFTIFPLKNISIQLFTIGPDFLSKEIRVQTRSVNRYYKKHPQQYHTNIIDPVRANPLYPF